MYADLRSSVRAAIESAGAADDPAQPHAWPAVAVTSPYNRASFFFGNLRRRHERVAGHLRVRAVLPGCRQETLVRDGEPVPLAPKVLETLLALIEHRDRVVTKDELLQRIWGDTVVEEGGLTRNISILRKALGEKPDDHHVHRHRARAGVSVRRGRSRARGRRSRRSSRARRLQLASAQVDAVGYRDGCCSADWLRSRRQSLTVYALAPSARRASGTTGDHFARRAAAGQSVGRPGAGVLRRRNDRGAHRQSCPDPRASSRLAHVGDAVQRARPALFRRSRGR